MIHLCGNCSNSSDKFHALGRRVYTVCHRCGLPDECLAYASACQQRRLARNGETEISTSTDIERWPSMAWDVSWLYGRLGLTFRATKEQIKNAFLFQSRHHEGGSHELAYIVKLLLDSELRAEYDSCQPLDVFVDKFLSKQVKEQLMNDPTIVASGDDDEEVPEGYDRINIDEEVRSHEHTIIRSQPQNYIGSFGPEWGWFEEGPKGDTEESFKYWRDRIIESADWGPNVTVTIIVVGDSGSPGYSSESTMQNLWVRVPQLQRRG